MNGWTLRRISSFSVHFANFQSSWDLQTDVAILDRLFYLKFNIILLALQYILDRCLFARHKLVLSPAKVHSDVNCFPIKCSCDIVHSPSILLFLISLRLGRKLTQEHNWSAPKFNFRDSILLQIFSTLLSPDFYHSITVKKFNFRFV